MIQLLFVAIIKRVTVMNAKIAKFNKTKKVLSVKDNTNMAYRFVWSR